jgi:sensor c-di-GMP phosphodiesterase-like protein
MAQINTIRLPFKGPWERVRFYASTIAALLAVLGGLPLYVYSASEQQIVSFNERVALRFARHVLNRSDRVSTEFQSGFSLLEAAHEKNPCSDEAMKLMRALVLRSSNISVAGYVDRNTVRCSSLGLQGGGMDIGPVTFTGAYRTRTNVRIPPAPGIPFIVVEEDSWVLFMLESRPIDIAGGDGISMATYSTIGRRIRVSRGEINPEWVQRGKPGQDITFVEKKRVVAIVQSERFPSGAIVALPVTSFTLVGMPMSFIAAGLALIAGGSLGGWIVLIAKDHLFLSRRSLQRALERNEFAMVYQPIVDLQTRRWVGAEALMRWRRSAKLEIPPDLFIAEAERSGLIHRFSRRMMQLVGTDAAGILANERKFYLSVNLAGDDFRTQDIVWSIRALLKQSDAQADQIRIEITERSVLDEVSAKSVINEIRAMGVNLIVDDFGVGFSNLKYLTSFQFDALKIDKDFVRGIGTGALTGGVAAHIIVIAKSLDLDLIAEGVETEAQATSLRDAGVQFAQGWLFSKPLSAADLAMQLKANSVL